MHGHMFTFSKEWMHVFLGPCNYSVLPQVHTKHVLVGMLQSNMSI